MDDKKNPWADFNNQIKKEREKENKQIKKKYSKEKLFKIALNFALKQDFQKALDYFKLVTEKDPKHFLAWVNTGIIYTYHNLLGTLKGRRTAYYKKHYDDGIECFKKALDLNPNDITSLIGIGDAFRGKKEFKKSIEYFEKIIKIAPKNSESWRGIGFAYLEMMEFEKAISYFEKVIKIEDKNVDCWIGLGISYFERQNLDESLNCLMNALNYQKQQEKPKKNIIGREIYSNKLETITKVIIYIESEKVNLAFINKIEKEFDIKFESKPSILTFFEDTQSKTANQDLIVKKDEELTKSDSKEVKMDRISVLEKKLLTSENENERLTVATELKKIGKEKARLALLKAYKDKSDKVRMKVIETIENSNNIENIPYLLKLLDDEKSKIRERSLKTLGKIGNSEILPYFLKKLIDPDEYVRVYAADAIGKFGDVNAVKYLILCLKKPERSSVVIQNIIWALGNIGDKSQLDLLIKWLKIDKESTDIRSEIALALSKIGGEKAFNALLEILNTEDWDKYLGNAFKAFKKNLIISLANFKSEKLTDSFINMLERELQNSRKSGIDIEIITSLIESLGQIGDNKMTEVLMKTLYDINEKIRLASFKALAELDDNDVNERLISILIDETEDLSFRKKVFSTLKQINKEDLINLLKSKSNLIVEEQIKKEQKIIVIKNEKNVKIGEISYHLSEVEILEEIKILEIKIKDQDLLKYIQSMMDGTDFYNVKRNRDQLIGELFTLYNKHRNSELIKDEITKYIIQFFTPYIEINPFEVKIQNFSTSFKRLQQIEINRLKAIINDNEGLENFYNKLIKDIEEKEEKEVLEEIKMLEIKIKEHDLKRYIQSLSTISEISNIMQNRSKVINELFSLYNKHKNNELVKEEIIKYIIQFYTPYFDINPFEVDIQNFTISYNGMRKSELNLLQGFKQDNTPLEEFYNKLESIDINAMINKKLKNISEEVNEINYDVPVENMFNFLLDFSQIIPSADKTDDSTENEYTLKTGWGPFYFKILQKELNKRIEYEYDFVADIWGEKGTFSIELIEPSIGKVIIRTRNNIQEISEKTKENLQITNFLGQYLKTYIDLGIGRIVAKQIQTIFYERTFDDLTMGNYRILQAKFNALGKDINELKARFFEVKSPLSLNSFECSECGATLNITSKEEKFIICEHCSTPFLMEWQKG